MSGNGKSEKGELEFRSLTVKISPDDIRKPQANIISTTKYTWYTWLPKSIWEQFRRVANVYFLLISILMLIGTYATYLFVTPLSPYSTVFTLIFVLLITSTKEGVEDLQRAKSDAFENNRSATVVTFLPNGEVKEEVKKSMDLNPGDIVKLEGHMSVPADMILVYTSLHEDGNKCYIETANIDGETNLKVREAPPTFLDLFNHKMKQGKVLKEYFEGELEFQQPNKVIHSFIGTMTLQHNTQEKVPLNAENLLLKSSVFSNTDWAYGIVVYAGQETKIQMNNRLAPSKLSQVEKKLNMAIIIIFWAQVVLVSFSVISIYIMGFDDENKLPYIYPKDEDSASILPLWLEQWFVFFLLYNNFIPISLYVTIELVNLGQAYFIQADEQLYHEGLDVRCTVKSSNLVQELGMVCNIFSDKTGTLTRNEMKLVKFVLKHQLYDIAPAPEGDKSMSTRDIQSRLTGFGPNQKLFEDFCHSLITCHTVIREKNGTYRAESPDELALVEGMAGYGCKLLERGSKEMSVELFGVKKTYEIMAIVPFSSDRKRMSVLLYDPQTQGYSVVCKGADNVMLPLIAFSNNKEEKGINDSLLQLANLGLRTLIISKKNLTAEEALNWLQQYKSALTSTTNREENIFNVGAKLEKNLNWVGVTAIEDRLQDEVPEVIADLSKAGIIVWMLTGDKLETAINIGHSCNLLLSDTDLCMITNLESADDFAKKLADEYDSIVTKDGCTTVLPTDGKYFNRALVIDGKSLAWFQWENVEQRFQLLTIGQHCRSVIACRMTPLQKSELVRLVKKDTRPKSITLSIGDGANDVAMIREANVGVGIFGKEGRQAANNADFAIGEFKFLRKLLLVHGRWNYIRQSKVFLYSMHKNMVLTLTLFWYSYYTAVSGTSLYESWVYSSFNFLLALPIIFFGCLDRDISADFVLRHPQVYSTGKSNSMLDVNSVVVWIFNAILYAIIISLIYFSVVAQTFNTDSLYVAGTTVFVGLTMSLQAKVAFFHHQWAYPQVLAMVISVVGMIIFFIIIELSTFDYYYVANHVYEQGIFWFFGMFTGPLIVVMIDWVGYFVLSQFHPKPEMIFRELQLKDSFFAGESAAILANQSDRSSKRGTNTKELQNLYDKEEGPIVYMDNPSPRPLSRSGSRSGSVSRPGSGGRRTSSAGSETEMVARKMLSS